jgi:hypothetical protein
MVQDNFRPVPGTGQTLAIGAASVPSAAIPAGTFYVRLSALGNCHVQVGMAPVATATDMLVKATDPPTTIRVQPGEKIAVIQDGASTGNLNLIGVTH